MSTTGASAKAVQAAVAALGALAQTDAPLGALTTYRVGGPAAVAATVRTEDDLRRVAEAVSASGLPVLVLGRGSNLLVADRGFAGIAVVLDPDADAFGGFEVLAPGEPDAGPVGASGKLDAGLVGASGKPDAGLVLRAGAALPLPALARRSVEAGFGGLEWAVGVPGTVGGGVRMNAGGHGSDIAATLRSCRLFDLRRRRLEVVAAADLGLGYRRSAVTAEQVVLDADFALGSGDPEAGRRTIRDIVRWRREHQPGGQNAGSVFVNPMPRPHDAPPPASPDVPVGASAGWFVEAVGLKGHRRGSALVSPKHANFVQADAGGSADDVLDLVLEVRDAVHERFGIVLRTEVRLVGFDDRPELSTFAGGSR